MATGITLEVARTQLDLWVAANTKVASGQEYVIGNRSLKRADAAEIRQQIDYWNGWVQRLSNGGAGGMRVRGGTPA